MAMGSKKIQWIVLGMSASIFLMVAQAYWLFKLDTTANKNGLRWQLGIGTAVPVAKDRHVQDSEQNVNKQRSNTAEDQRDTREAVKESIRYLDSRQNGHADVQNSTSVEKDSENFNARYCIPDTKYLSAPPKTPYKIFIYDLPREFNYDILDCVQKNECFDLDFCGMGEELYRSGNLSVRNTNQFALEVVLHHQLLFSPYRVMNPAEADVFYIPAYTGLSCFCRHQAGNKNTTYIISKLFHWLEQQSYYKARRLHLSALAKIEREQASTHCPLLKFPQAQNIIYATIEEETNPAYKHFLKIPKQQVIVVPYPSYGHIVSGATELNNGETVPSPPYEDRRVFVFLAAGARRSNSFRAIIADQFEKSSRTKMSVDEYFSRSVNEDQDMVYLITQECEGDHHRTTIGWMQRSVFCLQPPGDSPSRKSFYDAVIAGCIPVLFPSETVVNFPFQGQINYESFTVKIPQSDIETKELQVRKILSQIPQQEIRIKLKAVQAIAQNMQYSVPIKSKAELRGATALFMKEIGYILATWKMRHFKNPQKLKQLKNLS